MYSTYREERVRGVVQVEEHFAICDLMFNKERKECWSLHRGLMVSVECKGPFAVRDAVIL